MPIAPRRPPQGRGFRKGPDAAVNQNESYALRSELIPKAGGLVVGMHGDVLWPYAADAVTGTASALTLFLLPVLTQVTTVYEARIDVQTAVAASTTRAALYRYFRDPAPQFKKIAGTEVSFDTSSTGQKVITLASPVEVTSEARIYLAVWRSSASIALSGLIGNQVFKPLALSGVTPPFPPTILKSELTKTASDVPLVAYLSKEASGLL